MCAISWASTPATCDSLPAACRMPRWIQTGPPGSANALRSRLFATENCRDIAAPWRGPRGSSRAARRTPSLRNPQGRERSSRPAAARRVPSRSRPSRRSATGRGRRSCTAPARQRSRPRASDSGLGAAGISSGRWRRSRALAAVTSTPKEYDRRRVDPDQEHDHRGNRPMDLIEPGHVADVPSEAGERAAPRQPCDHRADPDITKPHLALGTK